MLASSIALLRTHDITIKQCAISKNAILGGSHPLIDILNFNLNAKVVNSLAKKQLIFLSQIISADGLFLLRYSDLNVRPTIRKSSGKIPWWFHKLESEIIEFPSISRRIKSRWHIENTSKTLNYLPVPDINRTRMHDWVAVWDRYRQQTIIGHIVNKNISTNSVIVSHGLHYTDNDLASPSYNLPIIYECPGCVINNPRYNSIWNSIKRRTYTTYLCTNQYDVDLCVKIPKVTNIKGTDHRILNVSLFELEHLAKARYDNFINNEITSNNSLELVSDILENDIMQFVNLDSRPRLQQFRDTFNN